MKAIGFYLTSRQTIWMLIAKDELQRAMKAYKGTIVLVCHEPEFYEGWISKVWNVEEWSEQLNK